jgi:FkbM family methyltransferase
MIRVVGFPLTIKIGLSRFVRKVTSFTRKGYHYNVHSLLYFLRNNDGKIKKMGEVWNVTFPYHGIDLSIFLRRNSSDPAVFRQIFMQGEYNFVIKFIQSFKSIPIRTIVDAGANIGLTSVQFSVYFPQARIVAVEADLKNLAKLRDNVAASGLENIEPLHRALWRNNGNLAIENTFRDKLEWSLRVTPLVSKNSDMVQGITCMELLDTSGGSIDLLKIDIEGAEKDFFHNEELTLQMLANVKFLVIELHDDIAFNKRFEELLILARFSFTSSGESLLAFNRNIV